MRSQENIINYLVFFLKIILLMNCSRSYLATKNVIFKYRALRNTLKHCSPHAQKIPKSPILRVNQRWSHDSRGKFYGKAPFSTKVILGSVGITSLVYNLKQNEVSAYYSNSIHIYDYHYVCSWCKELQGFDDCDCPCNINDEFFCIENKKCKKCDKTSTLYSHSFINTYNNYRGVPFIGPSLKFLKKLNQGNILGMFASQGQMISDILLLGVATPIVVGFEDCLETISDGEVMYGLFCLVAWAANFNEFLAKTTQSDIARQTRKKGPNSPFLGVKSLKKASEWYKKAKKLNKDIKQMKTDMDNVKKLINALSEDDKEKAELDILTKLIFGLYGKGRDKELAVKDFEKIVERLQDQKIIYSLQYQL